MTTATRKAKRPEAATSGALEAARAAGLRYVTETDLGIRRIRRGRGFRYRDAAGVWLSDPAELGRIRSLAIPPAWTDVRVCRSSLGHIQAVGRDARGRLQYRYHPSWRAVRDETKYGQLIAFARALPALRRRVEADLAAPSLTKAKVLAAVVRLLDVSPIRIGNSEYARANGSFGLTTLRNHHVDVSGDTLRFRFRGKSGKSHEVRVSDRRLARIVQKCQDIPGHELFQYVGGEGDPQPIDSSDVNHYLREATGGDFTAKVFRTWTGTVQAMLALRERPAPATATEARSTIVEITREVAAYLGNTPAVCRKSYIHPAMLEGYASGALAGPRRARPARGGWSEGERATLAYLTETAGRARRRAA